MRSNVETLSRLELGRPHLVEEDERPDHLPRVRGQNTAHLETAAEVASTRDNDRLNDTSSIIRHVRSFPGNSDNRHFRSMSCDVTGRSVSILWGGSGAHDPTRRPTSLANASKKSMS